MADPLLRELDDLRRQSDLSKADLARRLDLQPAAIRRLFTNEGMNPTLSTVKAMAEAMDYELKLVPASSNGSEPERVEDSPASTDLRKVEGQPFTTVLADPPWRFMNRTGKVAPEHRRLSRYDTMTTSDIRNLPVADVVSKNAHLYLWVPNALIGDGLRVLESWGFQYKSNLVWAKRRKDGGPDGRGVGFYFRNTTELILFGVRGRMRTGPAGRSQVNIIETRKREHSRKPDELYDVIEACSPGPYLELFARYPRDGWTSWGDEANEDVEPRGKQYPAYS